VLNTFDESALEAAFRTKDTGGEEVKITVLTLGHTISKNVMLKDLDSGFGIIAPHARKAFSPVAQNYNEYQKKILAALDEHGVSDTTFYTDVPD
jgi:electron transfer flavoprotein alpha/beta subunit